MCGRAKADSLRQASTASHDRGRAYRDSSDGQRIVAFLFSRTTREALLSEKKEGHT